MVARRCIGWVAVFGVIVFSANVTDARPSQSDRPSWPRLELPDPVARLAAREALDNAWELLGQRDCAGVLRDFADRAERRLDERLTAQSVDARTYLTMLVFIDGSRDKVCITGGFGFTVPGSRVVRLCPAEVKRTWDQQPAHATANMIHELLHTLGLGENPPSSKQITQRVLAACHREQ